jgi:hypothetical protein
MTNDELMTNAKMTKTPEDLRRSFEVSSFDHSFELRHSCFVIFPALAISDDAE